MTDSRPDRCNALILAGNRRTQDPIAAMAGVSHKALAPIAGKAMLARVYRVLAGIERVERIFVCIEDERLLDALPALAAARASGRLAVVASAESPAASLEAALRRIGLASPLLVTTADHALLTAAMVEHFLAQAPRDADLAVALASAEVIAAAYPGTRRTYYRLAGRGYSGCNLFLARHERARGVLRFWRELERHRKRPWRLVLAIGIWPLLKFATGRLDLAAALARLSRLTGARIAAVPMPFAEAAIDVDKPEDFALVETILARSEFVDQGRDAL